MKAITVFPILLFAASFSSLQAQTTNIWKGGFPGHETDWKHGRNWSLGRTPDVFDRVVIPDVSTSTRRFPAILSGETSVLSLEIQSGASLTLHQSVRIRTDEFVCNGTCNGCAWQVLIEGNLPPVTAAKQ